MSWRSNVLRVYRECVLLARVQPQATCKQVLDEVRGAIRGNSGLDTQGSAATDKLKALVAKVSFLRLNTPRHSQPKRSRLGEPCSSYLLATALQPTQLKRKPCDCLCRPQSLRVQRRRGRGGQGPSRDQVQAACCMQLCSAALSSSAVLDTAECTRCTLCEELHGTWEHYAGWVMARLAWMRATGSTGL